MKGFVKAALIGFIVGNLWQPVGAQFAERLFATLSTNLTTGTSTPLICTTNGSGGCWLNVQGH